MSKSFNIIITGGKGMVASQADFGITLGRKELDILNKKSIQKAIDTYKPDTILHLAAMTNMLECEEKPKQAHLINVTGTKNIALACKKNKIKLVYLSTCAVFNGKKKTSYKEKDKPNPLNIYGKTKWQGELEARKICLDALIIRTGWLFGGGAKIDKKFVFSTFQKLQKGLEAKATNDRFGSPTYAKDLLKTIETLINRDVRGIFHVINTGTASYFDIAKEIKKTGKFDTKIIPVKASQIENSNLKRGSIEALASSKVKLRSWQKALKEYVGVLQ